MFRNLSLNIILLYDFVILLGYIWFIIKYRKIGLVLLIISLFFHGIFADSQIFFQNRYIYSFYKITILLWSIFYFFKYRSKNDRKKYTSIITLFVLYASVFFISSIINNDDYLLIFSQLSKFLAPFLLFFAIMHYTSIMKNNNIINVLFQKLIIVQIIFNIAKLIIIGHPYEGLVGSMSGITGGGFGTSFPLLGLLWIAVNTKMNLKNKDIWMIIGLLFIGFMTGKRAIWLLFPIFFLLLSTYVYRRNYWKKLIYVIVLFPAFIYFGLRLSPTLNPDNKIWGKFDIEYAWNYSVKYSTGQRPDDDNIKKGKGRIGAISLAWDQFANANNYSKHTLFGYGCNYIYAADHDNYTNSKYYFGIDHRGSLTGVVLEYFAIGIFGIILHIIFLILIFIPIKNHRLRFVMCFLLLFDYIFYNSMIIRDPGMMVLMFYLIIYANRSVRQKIHFNYKKANFNYVGVKNTIKKIQSY